MMRNHWHRGIRWVLAPALLCGLLLAGALAWGWRDVDAAGHPRSGDPAGDAVPVGFPRQVTPAEDALLEAAEEALVADCMEGRGFAGWPRAVPRMPVIPAFPYVLDDVAWARQHGYGRDLERSYEAAAELDPREKYVTALPEQRRAVALAALNGLPSSDPRRRVTAALPSGGTVHRDPHSCRSTAETTLYGPLRRWFAAEQAASELTAMRQAMVSRDTRFTAAVAAWSRCMRAAGLSFATPGLAKEAFPPGQGNSREQEIRTAVTEAQCAQSTGLAGVAARLDEHYRLELRQRYPELVSTWLHARLAALPRAKTALRG